jgi:hypothetical protein
MFLLNPVRTLIFTFISGVMVGFAASGCAGAAAAAAYLDMKGKRIIGDRGYKQASL